MLSRSIGIDGLLRDPGRQTTIARRVGDFSELWRATACSEGGHLDV